MTESESISHNAICAMSILCPSFDVYYIDDTLTDKKPKHTVAEDNHKRNSDSYRASTPEGGVKHRLSNPKVQMQTDDSPAMDGDALTAPMRRKSITKNFPPPSVASIHIAPPEEGERRKSISKETPSNAARRASISKK